ncbi:MAG: preprotein translocase subunit SecG [Methylococcales bacterium]|jgi:preprotein translocase subunit SecG|nr:preprotein translocase subunit SecG [Methylococcales bacterium]MBT3699026.1 preprotein translocase subunit SecG [Methylococcales bacterium]MBT3815874.1 preprotein translocase subunit SecG [Methylococcales bacterium]MBT4032318.1 preprotein translocase subunit SecG [Methylococcales bacterium]MBT4349147.1 preprotein translocase subunit SecG [Methylococcales bacterium]
MDQILIITHVVISLMIIVLVMLQQGKGADAGAAFGGGGGGASGSLFGASGATSFLSRTTAICAVVFFSTSLALAFLSGYKGEVTDLMDDITISSEESESLESATESDVSADMPAIIPDDMPFVLDSEVDGEDSQATSVESDNSGGATDDLPVEVN